MATISWKASIIDLKKDITIRLSFKLYKFIELFNKD
jgi:hypothetical protein